MVFSWDTLKEEITITDCTSALLTHADLFLKYAKMYSVASSKKDELKWQTEKSFAIVREGLRRSSDGKVTEARLDTMTTSHPEYMAVRSEYLQACEEETALKLAIQVLSIRKDMLINLSASLREEAYQRIQSGTPWYTPQPTDALTALKESFSKKSY